MSAYITNESKTIIAQLARRPKANTSFNVNCKPFASVRIDNFSLLLILFG